MVPSVEDPGGKGNLSLSLLLTGVEEIRTRWHLFFPELLAHSWHTAHLPALVSHSAQGEPVVGDPRRRVTFSTFFFFLFELGLPT